MKQRSWRRVRAVGLLCAVGCLAAGESPAQAQMCSGRQTPRGMTFSCDRALQSDPGDHALTIQYGLGARVPALRIIKASITPSRGLHCYRANGSAGRIGFLYQFICNGHAPAHTTFVVKLKLKAKTTCQARPHTVEVQYPDPANGGFNVTYVRLQPCTGKCDVPFLNGLTLKDAKQQLSRSNCKLGKVRGPRGKKARIKAQIPKPRTLRPVGSKVQVRTG